MTDRIIIKETSSTFSPETYFTGELETIISILTDWKEEGEWEGIEEYWEQYASRPSYQLYKHRSETDEEYEMRMRELKKQNRQKVKEKEKRRKEYEKLKKEFEDT
jgi:hypothetical protein